ncbi:uncharacterized protein LOC110770048 [Prunus avium]|uniref:Uncharacterized protein LOC110770048 n=1 Tax=Prunus avium TaxID=42229 RepID=A0A6P5TRN5_PRUAV|nr:uncharacterized protein LOC110770048 [Prunus avium]
MSPTPSTPPSADLPLLAPNPLAIQSSLPPTAPPSPAPPVQPTHQFERHKVPNVRLQDYVCSHVTLPKDAQSESLSSHRTSSTRYPLSNFISYHRYTPAHLAFITHLSHSVEPRSFSEANSDPNWQQAMSSELQASESNHTWTLTPLPPAKMVTIRSLLALAAASSWPLHQLDVHNASLHGDLHEEIYMTPSPSLQ